ncbi:hypothetical protein HC251_09420 [Iamia sp. SCSIO 61187]|uniref:hypothetical protein n=1 Tax=Iamia sp. SCSIO 61187 TaxID=2722752 RepID=UPI001C63A8DA|nr:hypothetical protein [Iamia sp. SCSIO 61187]QYG92633.1 hypothetical protein HC251_09420 [Iamia sp. SCSIO 61187]
MRRTKRVVGTAAVVLLAAMAACGGDDDEASDRRLRSGEDFSIAAALAELPTPEDDAGAMVSVADLDGLAEATGRDRPDDEEGGREWLQAFISGTDDEVPALVVAAEPLHGFVSEDDPGVGDELGWSIADVEAFGQVQAAPRGVTVVSGDLGEGSLDDADLEDLGGGVVSAGSGEDLAPDVDGGATAARPGRVPLRMTADGDHIVASPSTEVVEAWRDGTGPVLADDAELVAVAEALDGAGALSAVLLLGSGEPGPEGLPVAPADRAGIGWSVDDGEAVITVAYAYPDATQAGAAAADLEAALHDDEAPAGEDAITDLLEVEEVAVDGEVVVATVRPGPEGRAATPYELAILRRLPGAPG